MFNSIMSFKKPGMGSSAGLPNSIMIALFCFTKKELENLSEAEAKYLDWYLGT